MMRKSYKFIYKFICLALLVSCSVNDVSTDLENSSSNWVLGEFVRPADVNPVISPLETEFFCPVLKEDVKWEVSDTFNPGAIVKDGKIVVLYRAEDDSGEGIGQRISRIGYAESTDGITMTRRKEPVFYPDNDDYKKYEWPGGCEDPRVAVTEDGTYVMLYTAWNRRKGIWRLSVATSKDLLTWEKHGPVFSEAYNGRFEDFKCKSGSILTKIKDGKIVVEKINGKYFMYWGENSVKAATSEDLVNWTPLLDENNDLLELAHPRSGYFDSRLTECGPPALMTDHGIVLLYNGKNGEYGLDADEDYPEGSYCAGQFLFDKKDPCKVLQRLDKPFFYPEADFEKSGQYVDGTVFLQGLAYLNQKFYLYYGCADSRVAVAIYDTSKK